MPHWVHSKERPAAYQRAGSRTGVVPERGRGTERGFSGDGKEHLAEKWLAEADFVLAEGKNLGKNDWLMTAGHLNNFTLVTQTAPQNCQDSSAMFLYRRK